MPKFVRGKMLVEFMIHEEIIPIGAQDVKIEGNINGEPMMITTTFIAQEDDAKKIMGYDFVVERI